MSSRLWRLTIGALAACCMLASPRPVHAQSPSRFSIDSVVEIDSFGGDNAVSRPNIIVDVAGVARIGNGWLLYARPWIRQPRTSEWDTYLYQAAMQYQRSGRVAMRVDLGYLASPVGLGMMDTRPGVNPTIMPHLTYFTPLPAFDAKTPRVGPIAATYPLGGQLTLSSGKWDVRAALVNTAPTRVFMVGNEVNPPAAPVVEGGAGISPMTGMRFGLSFAHGDYVSAKEISPTDTHGHALTQVAMEGEYGFGYTRVSGEIVRDALETATNTEAAYEWFIQGTQTLTPRWFLAGKSEGTSAPGYHTATVDRDRTAFLVDEFTVGFRISPELTLRTSIVGRKAFARTDWDRQYGASAVWAHRWW